MVGNRFTSSSLSSTKDHSIKKSFRCWIKCIIYKPPRLLFMAPLASFGAVQSSRTLFMKNKYFLPECFQMTYFALSNMEILRRAVSEAVFAHGGKLRFTREWANISLDVYSLQARISQIWCGFNLWWRARNLWIFETEPRLRWIVFISCSEIFNDSRSSR